MIANVKCSCLRDILLDLCIYTDDQSMREGIVGRPPQPGWAFNKFEVSCAAGRELVSMQSRVEVNPLGEKVDIVLLAWSISK